MIFLYQQNMRSPTMKKVEAKSEMNSGHSRMRMPT